MQITIKDLTEHRERYQPAPSVAHESLPLIEKQAIIEKALRHLPLPEIDCVEHPAPDGTVYIITKNWGAVAALLDFIDGKFKTWGNEEMQRWRRLHPNEKL